MDKRYTDLMESYPEWFENLPGGIEILTDSARIKQVEREFQTKLGVIYEDDYILLLKDAVRFSDQTVAPYIRAYHKNSGGVSILVLCGDSILLLKHFRHSLRRWLWETPRGFGEKGQTISENARRELHEELGVAVTDVEFLGRLVPDAGIIGETVTLYVARIPAQSPITTEKHEGIQTTALFTKEAFQAAVVSGEILDGITIASVAYAEMKGFL